MRRIREVWPDRDGASAVEFALVLPVLMLVFTGVFELSWLLSSQTVLNHATFQAARVASIARSAGLSEIEAAALAKSRAVNVYWMGTLQADGVNVTFDDSSDVSQVEVLTAVAYQSLTGWFSAGVLPAELRSKAMTPY